MVVQVILTLVVPRRSDIVFRHEFVIRSYGDYAVWISDIKRSLRVGAVRVERPTRVKIIPTGSRR
jgi:hypothetical protein